MIFIRADANEYIGSGHIMRCLSIANVLARRGERVCFITADHKADNIILENGMRLTCLSSQWNDLESELLDIQLLIKKENPSLLIVDSYYVTQNYMKSLSETVAIAYIDDMNLQPWNVKYILNYNIYSAVYDYSGYKDTNTKLLLGPSYVPLRDEFTVIKSKKIKKFAENILISAGGADPEEITERIMQEIALRHQKNRFHFVVGTLNPRVDKIKFLAKDIPNVVLHINEKNMKGLMQSCDIAIAAAGTTLYELCACGVPTITYIMADNQIIAAEQFSEQGLMINAGDCRNNEDFLQKIDKLLDDLIINNLARIEISKKMQRLVDGKGADRIADVLI